MNYPNPFWLLPKHTNNGITNKRFNSCKFTVKKVKTTFRYDPSPGLENTIYSEYNSKYLQVYVMKAIMSMQRRTEK